MLKKIIIILIILPSFNIFSSHSKSKKNQNLKNFINIGTLCEKFAFLDFKQKYPNKNYNVFQNIKYKYQNQDGELDLVVYSKITKQVIVVGEVKCGRDIKKASTKADLQLLRFKRVVAKTRNNNRIKIQFFSKNTTFLLNERDFFFNIEYIKIYPHTSKNKHFGFNSLTVTYTDILKIYGQNLEQVKE